MSPKALDDVRVIDLSRILAGPYIGMLLGDYGADVIKIEQPEIGDGTRQWGPPWVGSEAAYFFAANRNKRSLTLNLKSSEGLGILHQLLESADVLIENFKVGGLAKLGLDYETLAKKYPRLIYVSVTGYGQTGPEKDKPGYDAMIQAQGGIMSITGPDNGMPHKVGVAVVDVTTGLYATTAVLAALLHRERTGQGQQIDIALLDAQVGWLVNIAQNYLATGETPQRYGNAHPSLVPYETFETADGHIVLAIGSDDQFRKLCTSANRHDLWEDNRFKTNASRVEHREILVPILRKMMATRSSNSWLKLCQSINVPAGPINTIDTVLESDQVQARQMVQSVKHSIEGGIKILGPVPKLSKSPAEIFLPPPALSEHTDEILKGLGYTLGEIARLKEKRVI
ncbi:MAG: CaiB/BaiF CoA-transferase family protein [Chloroflexota bacterium]